MGGCGSYGARSYSVNDHHRGPRTATWFASEGVRLHPGLREPPASAIALS